MMTSVPPGDCWGAFLLYSNADKLREYGIMDSGLTRGNSNI